jgi:hypothetical protein
VSEFERIDACFNIGRLKKLKKLELGGQKASLLKEVPLLTLLITKTLLISSQISRNCHQVEILELSFIEAKLQDFAEFNATHLKEIELMLDEGPSIDEVLLVLVKSRQLRKVRLDVGKRLVPTFEVLFYFIMVMNHLEHLYLPLDSNRQLKLLRDKIHESILPSRPNFKFDVGSD